MGKVLDSIDKLPLSSSRHTDDEPQRIERLRNQNTYADLIGSLFASPSVVAFFGVGSGEVVTQACEDIAAELSTMDRRAIVVSVEALLNSNPIVALDQASWIASPAKSGAQNRYWTWPTRVGHEGEPFGSASGREKQETWLEALRRDFDAILLDCHPLQTTPGGGAIGAIAESAVLVVDGPKASRNEILRDQWALEVMGVKLAGCILREC